MSRRPVVPSDRRVIFAMGGGGFTMEPANPLLDEFVLSLAPSKQPRILFLPTASGDTTAQINAFHARFGGRACAAEHLSLFHLRDTKEPLAKTLLAQDIVYVGGGSMRKPIAGLGLLPGSLTVHADGEPERLPVWLASVRAGKLPGGWALDDGVGLLFAGRAAERLVSSRPGAGAERVDAVAGELVRNHLTPQLLGAGGALGGVDAAVQELRSVRQLRRGVSWERD